MALTRITKGVIKPNENYDTHNINSTGIITATQFVGNIGGNPTFSGNTTFGGNVSIAGTLTYEDVTNIDSVGIITGKGADINGDLDVDGHTNLDNVSIVGVTTITGSGSSVLFLESSNPMIRLTDTDNNVYSSIGGESGHLYFYTNTSTRDVIFRGSQEVARLTGDGLLGIGTVNPTAPIHLHKASADAIQKIESSNGAAVLDLRHTNGYGYINYRQDGAETFRVGQIAQFTSYSVYNPNSSLPYQLCVEGNGEVGINTHNPNNTLHLLRNSTNHGITFQRGGTNAGSASINVTSFGALDLTASNNFNITSGGSQQIIFNRGGTEVARFNTSGSLGIGTVSPDFKTTIAADGINASLSLKRTNTSVNGQAYGNIFYTTETGQNVVLVRGVRESSNADGAFTISTKTTSGTLDERFRINSGGNLQLGSSTDAGNSLRYLDISNFNTGGSAGSILRLLTKKSDGSSSTSADIVKYKAGGLVINNNEAIGTTGYISFGTATAGGSTTERLRIDSSGKLGVNVTSPSAQLHVENDNANSSTYYLNTDATVLIQNKNSNASAKTVLKLEGPVGGGDCAFVYGDSSANLIFSDRQNERLRITSSGTVQIAANGNLYVVGGGSYNASLNGNILSFDRAGYSYIDQTSNSGTLVFRVGASSANMLRLDTSNAYFPNGTLVLGTQNTSSGHINAYENMSFNIDSDNDDTNRYFSFHHNGNSASGTELLRIQEDGNIGVNQNSPTYKLDMLNGNLRLQTYTGFSANSQSYPTIFLNANHSSGNNPAHGIISVRHSNQNTYSGDIVLMPQGYYTSYGYQEVLRVSAYKRVGINRGGDPGHTLDVYNEDGSDCLRLDTNASASGSSKQNAIRFSTSGTVRAHVGVAVDAGRLMQHSASNDFCVKTNTAGSKILVGAEGNEIFRISKEVVQTRTLSGGYYPVVSARDGSSSGRAASSAWEIKKTLGPAAKTGYYYLKDATGTVTQWWCDMHTDGGGWILIAHHGDGAMSDQSLSGAHWWDSNDRGGFDTVGSGFKRGGGYWRGSGGAWAENTCGQLMWDVRVNDSFGFETNSSHHDTAEAVSKVVFNWGTDQAIPTGSSSYSNIPNAGNRRFNEWCYEVYGAPGFNPSNYHQNATSTKINGANYFTEHMVMTFSKRGTGGAADDGEDGPYYMIGAHAAGLHQHHEESLSGDSTGNGRYQVVSNQDRTWNGGGSNDGMARLSKIGQIGHVNVWMR